MSLIDRPVLLLNASLEPIRIIDVKKSMTLLTKGVAVVEIPTDILLYPGIYVPSVIRLITYAKVPYKTKLVNKRNIYLRDGYRCQYCGVKFPTNELTWDHVMPKSRGGGFTWDNLVTCCHPCNRKKDDMTPEEAGMPLLRRVLPATVHTSRGLLRSRGMNTQGWDQFLYVDHSVGSRYQAKG
jgi:hypothetical protein